jgi:hypothetical protein
VHCGAQGAEVTISGTFVRITELLAWANECQLLLERTNDAAEFPTLEPNLTVEMKLDERGHLETRVEISPDHLTQQHTFLFDLDQSYLPSLISAINKIAARFPERGVQARLV